MFGRDPDLIPSVSAVADEAPDDQRQAECGDQRVEAAVAVGADPLDQAPAGAAQAGENVDAEHQDEAERENEHVGFLQAASGAMA